MKKEYKSPPVLKGLDFNKEEVEDAQRNNRLLRISIELCHNFCNLRCIYCYSNSGEETSGGLTTSEIFNIIDQSKELGAKSVILTGGGEPLINPQEPEQYLKVVDYIYHQGLTPVMFTNGTLITKEIAQRLYKKNVSIIAKLNSLEDSEITNTLSGRNWAHKKMMEGINNLIDTGFNREKPTRLGVESIVCKQNYHEIPNFWRWMRENNIFPYIELTKIQGRAISYEDILNISKEQAKELFYQILKIDEDKFGYTWIPVPPLIGFHCFQYYCGCYVNTQGFIQPCGVVNLGKYGRSVRHYKLKEILDFDIFQRTKNIDRYLEEPCKSCEFLKSKYCYGCRGSVYSKTGNIFGPDSICWHSKANKKCNF